VEKKLLSKEVTDINNKVEVQVTPSSSLSKKIKFIFYFVDNKEYNKKIELKERRKENIIK
jgi:hypothetical protein